MVKYHVASWYETAKIAWKRILLVHTAAWRVSRKA